jgi:hypothetical protein
MIYSTFKMKKLIFLILLITPILVNCSKDKKIEEYMKQIHLKSSTTKKKISDYR